ncbi:outer membrane beta-barrel protein [Tenacibaculum sp. 190524A02b]|uniref:Porin family protein n=1 Tax=Tenacibaculum vairaonense TaxID=3137860 RepID=A0ABP1F3G6_9FLAO
MKKVFLIVMILGFGIANGQEKNNKKTISKGTWHLAGGISLNSSNNSYENFDFNQQADSDSFGFNFSPKIGYTISNNLVVGLGLRYGYHQHENRNIDNSTLNNNSTNVNNSFTIAPYIKKYFSISERFLLSLQGELSYLYSQSKLKNSINNRENKNGFDRYSIGIRPGVTYFVSKNIALEANLGFLGYTTSSPKNYENRNVKASNNNFSFNFNSSNIVFGVAFYL